MLRKLHPLSYRATVADVKLLWECCVWVYKKQLFALRKQLKVPLGKEKERFDVQHRKYLGYAKLKRKAHNKKHKRVKSLLNLLSRGLAALQALLNTGQLVAQLDEPFYEYLRTIKQVLQQQGYLYHQATHQVSDRIVSLHKPYIRPIKRGKENKPTEFGAKVHMMQTDGLCWIEYCSFRTFNECKRFKISVIKHKVMFGECRQASADRIPAGHRYATNENRRFCSKHHIFHNRAASALSPRDQNPKISDGLKSSKSLKMPSIKNGLTDGRAAASAFRLGNHKNHDGLGKVKARNEANERVWIYRAASALACSPLTPYR